MVTIHRVEINLVLSLMWKYTEKYFSVNMWLVLFDPTGNISCEVSGKKGEGREELEPQNQHGKICTCFGFHPGSHEVHTAFNQDVKTRVHYSSSQPKNISQEGSYPLGYRVMKRGGSEGKTVFLFLILCKYSGEELFMENRSLWATESPYLPDWSPK